MNKEVAQFISVKSKFTIPETILSFKLLWGATKEVVEDETVASGIKMVLLKIMFENIGKYVFVELLILVANMVKLNVKIADADLLEFTHQFTAKVLNESNELPKTHYIFNSITTIIAIGCMTAFTRGLSFNEYFYNYGKMQFRMDCDLSREDGCLYGMMFVKRANLSEIYPFEEIEASGTKECFCDLNVCHGKVYKCKCGAESHIECIRKLKDMLCPYCKRDMRTITNTFHEGTVEHLRFYLQDLIDDTNDKFPLKVIA